MPTLTSSPTTATRRRVRWPYLGRGQALLLAAGGLLVIGSFLPWVDTAVGTFSGLDGAGLYTLSAGAVATAGAMLRRRSIVVAHAAVAGLAGCGLAAWQFARLVRLLAGGPWAPHVGLLLVAAGGVLALSSALQLHRTRPA